MNARFKRGKWNTRTGLLAILALFSLILSACGGEATATTAPAAVTISPTTNGMPPPFGSTQQFTPKTKVFLFEHTYAISPRITNQLKYGYGRYQSTGYNQSIGPGFGAAENGIKGLPGGQTQDSFPTVTFTGNTNINRWAGYSSNQNTANGYVLVDNVQWNVGKHSLTMGGQLVWMQYNFLNNATGVNPLQHYETFGWKEGRDPSASFDTLKYLAANPDVANDDIPCGDLQRSSPDADPFARCGLAGDGDVRVGDVDAAFDGTGDVEDDDAVRLADGVG